MLRELYPNLVYVLLKTFVNKMDNNLAEQGSANEKNQHVEGLNHKNIGGVIRALAHGGSQGQVAMRCHRKVEHDVIHIKVPHLSIYLIRHALQVISRYALG